MKGKTKKETVYGAIAMLNRLTSLFQRRRAELAGEVGLTEQQWLVLEQISTRHFIPSLFADERESSRPAVSRIIRQLMDKGVLTATLDPDDGRQRLYALTALGEKKMARLRTLREKVIDKIWMNLDAKALGQFSDFSEQLVEAIENYS